jgi:hypothetical protein
MTYKFYITHNSQPPVEVFPMKFVDSTIDYEKESGEVFFRRKFNGSLKFVNNNGGSDFTYFKSIDDGADRCLEISLDIHRACNDVDFESWWQGYFSVTDGDWNLDRCTVEFKDIKPDDEYRCILDKSEREVNILDASPIVETTTTIVTDYEYHVCRDTSGTCAGSLPPGGGWLLFHTEQVDGAWTSIYYREKIITACLGGVAQDPAGAWTQISDDCATSGFATYVRTPVIVYDNNPNPDVAPGDCEDDGSGGYIESFPPRKKVLTVNRTNTPVTFEIVGYDKAFASASGYSEEYTFKIKNPNPASTYTWSESGSGWAIVSGQGTGTVVVRFLTANPSVIQVIETTICSTAAAITFNVDVQSATGTTLSILQDPTGVTNVCKGQEGVIFRMPTLPELFTDNITWQFIGGAGGCTIVSGQGTDTVEIDIGDGSVNPVNLTFIAENNTAAASGTIGGGIMISISNAARTPDIIGLSTICPNSTAIPYEIQTRPGASYLWTVSGGTIASGQGTGSITVDWLNTVGSGSVTVKETINCGCNFVLVTECGGSGQPCFYWCPPDGTEITYDQNRLLIDVLTLFSDNCDLDQVESDFFEMNPPGDAPGYVAGLNYVTGAANKVSNLMMAQKSDIIDPEASNPATRGMITFNEIATILKEMFQVYWFIDGDSLRFEHISYFNRVVNPDFVLTGSTLRKWIIGKNAYTYEKDKMPKFERYKWSEAQNTDFVGYEISYDSACVNQDPKSNIKNHLPGNVTTDLIFINSDPDEINKEGFVMIANDLVGSTYVVASEAGLITGLIKPNMHLSWANLHYNYHRHERVLLEGEMNNEPTNFITAKRTKKQENIPFPFCCDASLNPLTDLITTYLGNGEINKLSLNLKTNMMTSDLLHAV